MLITEIKTMLAETKLPATYYSWPEKQAPQLPYLVWYLPSSDNFAADDKVYKHIETLHVELYTETKDFAAEKAVEDVLDGHNMVWERQESYIETEHMYEVLYIMEVAIESPQ